MIKPEIDIVLPWVDGSDRDWLDSYSQYLHLNGNGDSRSIRYRDWDLLRYWFRGVEKFMPWVRKVHFVTSGHIPEWLNLDYPQLNWVKHKDFIPEKYLPTFNANTIELNLHRIESLSDCFIYFNDDLFVLQKLRPERFFKNRLPCDYAVMAVKPASGGIFHMVVNDLDLLNSNFDKHKQLNSHFFKWFNLSYGKRLINNMLLYSWKEFTGFIDPHLANPFLKSTFSEVWEKAPEILNKTCMSKFRSNEDVNQWLMRYWQLAKGDFTPYNTFKNSLNTDLTDALLTDICRSISNQEYEMICLNDNDGISDSDKTKALLKESFEKILTERSAFEK